MLVGAGLLFFFTVCAILGAVSPERFLTESGNPGAQRIIATVIAVFFGALSLFMIAALPAALRTHGLAVDRSGIWYVTKKKAEPVPWPQIRAIGGSWVMAPKRPTTSLGGMIGRAIVRAATTDDGRERFAVEFFLRDPRSVAGLTRLELLQKSTEREQPPRPGLPGARLRFVIRGIGDYREMAAHLHRCAPGLWVGEYRR